MKTLVMLADKSAIYSGLQFGMSVPVGSTFELAPEVLDGFAKEAAAKLGGQVLRAWHDHGAGGAFAEIEVNG